MTADGWLYSAIDVSTPLVINDVPTREQYGFLFRLRENERPFLPPEWRNGDAGFRAMLLDVQNAINYLVAPDSFEAEREAVEKEGGALPSFAPASGVWQFLKALRIEMALAEFLGKKGMGQRRMKCRSILKRCGVRRRSAAFCHEFETAAAFYHIGLRLACDDEASFSIDGFALAETVILSRL